MANNELNFDFLNGQLFLTAGGATKVISADAFFGSAAWENVGSSGNTIPLLDGVNTWSQGQTFTFTPKVGGDYLLMSGSNSDGEWVRYFDGTQIVYGDTGTIAAGSYVTVTWAQPFIAIPSVSIASVTRTGYLVAFGSSDVDYRKTTSARVYCQGGATNSASYVAIGRWK